jgi:2-dehydro-3-deoxygalactonokinase
MIDQGFLALDWGTTNLRAWRLGPDGAVMQAAEFPLGVSRLAPGDAATRFEREVRPALDGERLPALACGMIGSNLGWIQAPYIDCPASLETLAGGLIEAAPGVRIVPGLRCAGLTGPDVMRGEETQILGWLAGDPDRRRGRRLLIHPGTHAKWVTIDDGVLTRFNTSMTGELYSLLGAQSVLRFADGSAEDDEAFDAGAAAAGDGGALAARLFGLRGLVINDKLPGASAGSWLSGLLIGAEVGALWPMLGEGFVGGVDLLGDAALCARYARVLTVRGVPFTMSNGEAAVLAGLIHIWRASR